MVEKINRIIRQLIKFSFCAAALVFCPLQTAKSGGLTLISDIETQNYLSAIVRPLFNAAGVRFDENKIFIVSDNSLNAFVSDGNYLFVNTGTLLTADDTNELAGILAHETGHIMGGHIVRQKLKMENMQYVMLGSMLAAGAAAVSTGRGDAAMAVLLGSQSSALNSMLHYQVEEERSADESAVRLLSQTKQSTAGLKRFMGKVKKQNNLSGIEENAYFRTHPLTNERISHFNEAAKSNNFSAENALDSRLRLIKAKLSAFMEEPKKVWRRYPKSRTDTAAQYAHAILYFREGKIEKALSGINKLIAAEPAQPYFYELKGQFLFESGRVKESISAYRTALDKLPDMPLLQNSLAHALLENNPDKAELRQAINLLQQALVKVKSPYGWQLLSRAYAMDDNLPYSYYAAAEFNYAIRNEKVAQKQLEKAEQSAKDKSLLLKISDLRERLKKE